MESEPIRTIQDHINVSASVIADISSGIYRSPANALKELISNSFDADATKVIISTGHPDFEVMTAVDDGEGMTAEDFRKYMRSIGGSYKREEGRQLTRSDRPIIGKIGIGILAVGQICRQLTIMSSRGSGERFEVDLSLEEFHDLEAHKTPMGQIGIGEYTCNVYREEPKRHYTKVVLKNVDSSFRARLMQGQGPFPEIKDWRAEVGDPRNFSDFVKWLRGKKIQELSEYDKLVLGLAIAGPIEYLEEGPVVGYAGLRELKARLKGYNFKVFLDGLELRKPLLFPFDIDVKHLGQDYWVYDKIRHDSEVDGNRLKFTGYVYAQRKRIFPPEFQGLLIRVRNVAIGTYDRSLMNYPKSEGPRPSFVSGEIYVDQGLEDALNIDRNSFRETHAHYLALQSYVRQLFGAEKGIFSKLKTESEIRMRKRHATETRRRYASISDSIERIFKKRYEILALDEGSEKPVQIDEGKKAILLYQHPFLPRKAAEKDLVQTLLILFEVAYRFSGDKKSLRENFLRLLEGLQ